MTIEVFIKKPEKVEVLQYDGTNYDEVVKFAGEEFCKRIEGRLLKGNYIVKYDGGRKIQFTDMSLERLQEIFEVQKESERKTDDDKITSNVDKITSNNCDVKKYRKKPIIVEAVQNTGDNYSYIMGFTNGECKGIYSSNSKGYVFLIETLEGVMVANVGDYIIKGVKGEFYPCKPDVFEATYDVVNE